MLDLPLDDNGAFPAEAVDDLADPGRHLGMGHGEVAVGRPQHLQIGGSARHGRQGGARGQAGHHLEQKGAVRDVGRHGPYVVEGPGDHHHALPA